MTTTSRVRVTPAEVIGADLAISVEVAEDGCWNWTAVRNPAGYGRVYLGQKQYEGAHRLAYIAAKGEIPAGLEIDHLCCNPSCVNPDHLEAVTHAENIRRGSQNRKRPEPKTHCKRGHELTPENRTAVGSADRLGQCRRCVNENRNERDRAKRAAAIRDRFTTDDEAAVDGKTLAAGD